jgi:hypothetical protein
MRRRVIVVQGAKPDLCELAVADFPLTHVCAGDIVRWLGLVDSNDAQAVGSQIASQLGLPAIEWSKTGDLSGTAT